MVNKLYGSVSTAHLINKKKKRKIEKKVPLPLPLPKIEK
jgi:hypothetical protein